MLANNNVDTFWKKWSSCFLTVAGSCRINNINTKPISCSTVTSPAARAADSRAADISTNEGRAGAADWRWLDTATKQLDSGTKQTAGLNSLAQNL